MFVYKGGQKVRKGTYWNLDNWKRIDVAKEEVLPESEKGTYLKIAPVFMLIISPVLGLFFFVFLPVATIVLFFVLSARKTWRWMIGLIRRLAYFEWRPSEAYLTGKQKPGKETNVKKDSSKPG